MPLVFAGISPHPPVLIPEIGKENLTKLAETKPALETLEKELYAAKPDSLLVISPHGKILEDSFSINLSADYNASFKEFGDFSLSLKFKSDYLSIQEIRAGDETNKVVPIVLTSEPEIDHGSAVPLYYLLQHLKDLPIIPISPCALSYSEHFKFGQFLYQQLSRLDKRYGVIASGDLSHKLTKDTPAGYSAKGAEFDKKLVDLIAKKDIQGILNLDPKLIGEASECGLRSIIVLLGIIDTINVVPEVLSYEGPFGVGYAVVNFKFQ